MSTLPSSFPEGTVFFDVEGVPVSLAGGVARAWDTGKPRWFLFNAIDRNENILSEGEFRAKVAAREARLLFPCSGAAEVNSAAPTAAPHTAEQILAEEAVARFVEGTADPNKTSTNKSPDAEK